MYERSGGMWWRHEKVKDTTATNKAAFKELNHFPLKKNTTQYKPIRHQTSKVVARAIRKKGELESNNL